MAGSRAGRGGLDLWQDLGMRYSKERSAGGLLLLWLSAAAGATEPPAPWDPETGRGVVWTAELGSETYGGPTVAGGKVFVGTNNATPRDPAVEGDHGVLAAFRAADGAFLWQAVHPKLAGGAINDWPHQGVGSTPAVAGDRLYYVSNRAELLALDTEGFQDGENDGPFREEARSGERYADVVWRLDMVAALGVFPHHLAASSPLVVGDLLFVGTGNGVDGRGKVPRPAAPSLLAVDRRSGEVRWSDASPGAEIVDGQWSSPAHGTLGGREQLVFAAGDGRVYAFDPGSGERLWHFDASSHLRPSAEGKAAARENLIADPVFGRGLLYLATGHDPELGPGEGRLWALAGGRGEIAASSAAWSYAAESFSRVLGTPALAGGLLYVADVNGFLHCLDAATGERLWEHDAFASVWAGPLVAGGKVYLGDQDGDLAVLAAGRERRVLAEIYLGDGINTTPAAAAGLLYVATRSKLFALRLVEDEEPTTSGGE